MKIEHPSQIAGAPPAAAVKPASPRAENGPFEALLRKALEPAGATRSESVAAPEAPAAATAISAEQRPAETQALDRTEQLLELLDAYRRQLGDPSVNLREIYPLIERMDEVREHLAPLLDALPEGSDLKQIANEAAVIAAKEGFRFNKGDYSGGMPT